MCGSMPSTSSFPYPTFMHGVAPYLSDNMDPHAFNALCGMANEYEMAQQAKVTEENQVEAQQTNQAIPGHLSVDSHSNAPVASGHSAARQSFDSSRSFNRRGIGEDGVRRANTASDASDSAAGSSTPKDAGTRYELRTENSRHSPNRFTPSC
ncbi:hypothetical protein PIB30_076968 [Stylosanthes scabra]|uniref:Uncharacterized protein n=1 Tax=Stylosanthes scabra TaxID=79078 RepID=A0ABU6SQU2_9FABA|nr:hypothetical protein [Stylosanthes scabra]